MTSHTQIGPQVQAPARLNRSIYNLRFSCYYRHIHNLFYVWNFEFLWRNQLLAHYGKCSENYLSNTCHHGSNCIEYFIIPFVHFLAWNLLTIQNHIFGNINCASWNYWEIFEETFIIYWQLIDVDNLLARNPYNPKNSSKRLICIFHKWF